MSVHTQVGRNGTGSTGRAFPTWPHLGGHLPPSSTGSNYVRLEQQVIVGPVERRKLATQAAMMRPPIRRPFPVNLRSGATSRAYRNGGPDSFARPYNASPAVPGEPTAAGAGLAAQLASLFRR